MATVLLVVHLLIAAALVAVVLVQRSEGGALGIGSGGGGGFMTGRGTANMLTRVTAALAGLFFLTSIGLSLLAQSNARGTSPLDRPAAQKSVPGKDAKGAPTAPAAPSGGTGGVLDSLQQGRQALPPTQKQ